MLTRIITWLARFFPTSKNILVFNSYPDFTDNPYGLYRNLEKKNDGRTLVWLVTDQAAVEKVKAQVPSRVKVFKKHSLKGLWYFFRCGYLFVSHGIFNQYSAKKSSKIVVNLWHGMPLKCIGFMDPSITWVTYSDYTISTSPMFQEIMAKSFNKPLSRVLSVGQPRNDLLFEKTDFFEKRGIDAASFNKIGMWLPTYRHSKIQQRQDGEFHEDQLLFLKKNDLEELDAFLREQNQLLIVKLHPMDSLQDVEFPKFKNLLILKQKDLDSQLYPLLGSMDYLLTDYSSVWLDYEILDKPMGFVCDDMDSYANSRGFTYDNVVKYLPGPVIPTLESLKEFLKNPTLMRPADSLEFNTYKDAGASDRLLSLLDSLSKEA